MPDRYIPFNKPYMTGNELRYITEAHNLQQLAGNGTFTQRCQNWISQHTHSGKSLLTHSCTAALEISALLLDIQPGDEVIMPSYTFVSTANAFALRGATPVFVDIRPDTGNLNESLIEEAITPRTRAIVPVHYAGVACEMNTINEISHRHGIPVVEDAAQALFSSYQGQALGSFGITGCFSFHETKNIISGEGGALVINDPVLENRAEIFWEKGTDRSRFFRGQVDKYTWQSVGSSYLPGELIAAFLWAQLEQADQITSQRLQCWNRYHERLEEAESLGLLRRPIIPQGCQHNAHMYYVLLPSGCDRQAVLDDLSRHGINAVFHYVPLHSSPYGEKHCRTSGQLAVTEDFAARIIRLPLWVGLTPDDQEYIAQTLTRICHEQA